MVAFDDLAEANPARGDNLLVIDGLNLSFRWKHSGQFDFADDFVSTIESFARSYDCGTIVVLADYKGSSYRTELHPEYKGNRKAKFKDQTEAEADDFKQFIEGFNDALDAASAQWPMFKFEGVEADDTAAYIVHKYYEHYNHIWLISTDRDWDLLLSNKVSRFSYITRKEYTLENWSDRYTLSHDKFIDLKVLQGDSGDNVFGIPGVGPKRAEALLDQYGSAFDIYASLPLPGKAQYIQNLNASGELIPLNYQLMDLETFCEEAIGKENLELISF